MKGHIILATIFGVSGTLALFFAGQMGLFIFVMQTLIFCPLIIWAGLKKRKKAAE